MRAKLFAKTDSSFSFTSSSGKIAEQLEDQINSWLERNPDIRVVKTEQSSSGGSFGPSTFWVSVWYEPNTEQVT